MELQGAVREYDPLAGELQVSQRPGERLVPPDVPSHTALRGSGVRVAERDGWRVAALQLDRNAVREGPGPAGAFPRRDGKPIRRNPQRGEVRGLVLFGQGPDALVTPLDEVVERKQTLLDGAPSPDRGSASAAAERLEMGSAPQAIQRLANDSRRVAVARCAAQQGDLGRAGTAAREGAVLAPQEGASQQRRGR